MKRINKLVKKGLLIDGTGGGLLLGRSHTEGGIYLLYPTYTNFRLAMEVEGYEYIINKINTQTHQKEIGKINNHDRDKYDSFIGFDFDDSITILDARAINKTQKPKYVAVDDGGFAIINKFSTDIYLKEIEFINRKKWELKPSLKNLKPRNGSAFNQRRRVIDATKT